MSSDGFFVGDMFGGFPDDVVVCGVDDVEVTVVEFVECGGGEGVCVVGGEWGEELDGGGV